MGVVSGMGVACVGVVKRGCCCNCRGTLHVLLLLGGLCMSVARDVSMARVGWAGLGWFWVTAALDLSVSAWEVCVSV